MNSNISENKSQILISKYSQKPLDHAKQYATDVFKSFSKRVIQNTAEANDDLIGNKIADKITRSSNTSTQNNLKTNEEILREKILISKINTKNCEWSKINGQLMIKTIIRRRTIIFITIIITCNIKQWNVKKIINLFYDTNKGKQE